MPRIRGEALTSVVKSIPDWEKGDYETIAWAVFRAIRAEGNTVEFPDILVTLDTLRGVDTELSRSLRNVTRLAERARALRPLRVEVSSSPSSSSSEDGSRELPPLDESVLPARGMSLLAALGDQPCIRFYVESASNKGHQSATVTLARKLLEWMRSPLRNRNLNLDLVFEFVCNDATTLEKARSILGGGELDGVPVRLRTWPGTFESFPRVAFAFSGAIDRPAFTFEKLNADCLVALQPYGWLGGPEALFVGKQPALVLTRGSQMTDPEVTPLPEVRFPLPFCRLPFTERSSSGGDTVQTATTMPDRVVTTLLDAVRRSAQSDAPLFLCPLYGMGKGQPMGDHGETVWFNVGHALLELHRRCGIRVILLNVSLDMGESASGVWPRVQKELKGAEVFTEAITHLEGLTPVLEAAVVAPLTVCTVTGGKSQWVMDRVYRESALPPIFEGQGSLTQVLCMGRPFLKVSMRATPNSPWTSDYLPAPGFEGMDEALQQTANLIIERKGDPAARAEQLALLMIQMFKPGTVQRYFEQCRRMVVSPAFDRLAWAMEALAELRK